MARVSPKLSLQVHDGFYRERFGSVRKGATYVLDALPDLLDRTWNEIAPQIPPSTIKNLAQGRLEFAFDGALSTRVVPPSLKQQIVDLSEFERVAMEFHLFGMAGSSPDAAITASFDMPHQAKSAFLDVSDGAAALAQMVGGGDANVGTSILLDRFARWYRLTLASIPKPMVKESQGLLKWDLLESPSLAGHLLPLRYAYASSPPVGEETLGLPAFACAVLEIEAMSATKKKKVVQASPKISPVVATAHEDLFGNANLGFGFSVTVFPRLYQQTLNAEVLPQFTKKELYDLAGLADGMDGLANSYTAGDYILHAPVGPALQTKIRALSPFARVCLEVWLAQESGVQKPTTKKKKTDD